MATETKFGCSLPSRGPMGSADTLRGLARAAEELGFDSVWVSDHIVIPERVESTYPYSTHGRFPVGPEGSYLEPLTVLTYLAAVTSRVRLGTHVLILPYRNPVVTAKIIATLDVLSGGRLNLGIGVGWMREEFEALGYDYFERRGAVTDEQIRVMKALWTEDVPSFSGEFYRFAPVGAQPHPVQRPHPPIFVGGHTRAAIRRAARLGDVWMPIGARPPAHLPPEELASGIARLRLEAARAGRDPAAIQVCFSTEIGYEPLPRDGAGAPFHGEPSAIAEDIQRYRAVGVDRFVVSFPADSPAGVEAAMRRFARQVRPELSG